METKDITRIGLLAALLIIFVFRFEPIMRGLLLVFLAALLALFLVGSGTRLGRKTGVPQWAIITGILVLSACLVAAVISTSGDAIARQADQLGDQLTPAMVRAADFLMQYAWGQRLLTAIGDLGAADVLPRVEEAARSFADALLAVVIVLGGGLLIAYEPKPYRAGMLWFAPKGKRKQFEHVLDDLSQRLYRWTIGRLASMAVVFVLTLIGLWLLGSPLPLLLALIAGLLSFVPNFGPISSAVLAALVGLSVNPLLALWILLLFIAVQLIESNITTPLIERRAVSLPVGFILLFQAIMGLAFGILGLIVATPLAVAIITVTDGVRAEL